MRLSCVLAIAALATCFASAEAVAQSNSSARIPAEFPPASYTGRQYVDSRGCVFIRAGIDGQTTWVPRVTRDRKVICGFKPSVATASNAEPAPAKPAPAQAPTIITVPQQTTAAAPKPAPKSAAQPKRVTSAPKTAAAPQKVRRAAPAQAPKTVAVAPQTVTQTPKTATIVKPSPKPAAKRVSKAPRVAAAQTACPGASAVSQKYLPTKGRLEVRCGPQAQPHSYVLSGGGGSGTSTRVVTAAPMPQSSVRSSPSSRKVAVAQAPQATRVAPRHVYENQLASNHGISVPEGYKPVWDDDRLNPRRAHQTFVGKARMDVVWTKTVPRRLINRKTGREVTHNFPGLQYPYTSFEQQRAAGVIVATRGQMVPDPITVTRARDGSIVRSTATRTRKPVDKSVRSQAQARSQSISTRSVAPKPAKAASHRYVQVGIFSEPSKAQRAAQRLANAGLPARMGKTTHKGKPFTSVVVGPFSSQERLESGMRAVRRAGYPNAYYRK